MSRYRNILAAIAATGCLAVHAGYFGAGTNRNATSVTYGTNAVTAIYSGSNLVWSALSPPPSGISFWYDFSDTTTVSLRDGYVSSVVDRSGNGYNSDLSASTTLQPLYSYSAKNGLNCASFNGAANAVKNSCSNSLVKTFAVVTRVLDTSGLFFYYSGSLYAGVYAEGGAAPSSSGVSSLSYYANGELVDASTRGKFYTVIGTNWNVVIIYGLVWISQSTDFSAFNYSGFGATCEVGEMLAYPRVLSAEELAQLSAYLGRKWGITVTH